MYTFQNATLLEISCSKMKWLSCSHYTLYGNIRQHQNVIECVTIEICYSFTKENSLK